MSEEEEREEKKKRRKKKRKEKKKKKERREKEKKKHVFSCCVFGGGLVKIGFEDCIFYPTITTEYELHVNLVLIHNIKSTRTYTRIQTIFLAKLNNGNFEFDFVATFL